MDEKDFSEFGKEIENRIEQFVNSKELKELQKNIKLTVNQTMDEMKRSFLDTTEASEFNNEKSKETVARTKQFRPESVKIRQLPVVKRPKGAVAGILFTVFGIIGSVVFWGISLVCALFGAATGWILGLLLFLLGFTIPAALVCTIMCIVGGVLRRRTNRFKAYVKAMNEKDFYSIKGLAQLVGKKERFVVKDLKKMIVRKWFWQGHVDTQETCFMLTDEAYGLYQNAQNDLEKRRSEAETKEKEAMLIEQNPERKQLIAAVEEGREYIRRIRKINDEIPGEEISNKLYRLEKINLRIFDYVEKNPDRLPYIRKFMNYYLPTTLKLVEAYAEFGGQPIQGENIKAAKLEIEEMLEDINKAFEKMFDKLFAEDAMDISTDISVLSAMLAQEGLLEDAFKKSTENDTEM